MTQDAFVRSCRSGWGTVSLAVVGAALLAGLLIGADTSAEEAGSPEPPSPKKELVPVSLSPPAIAVARTGWAVVGGADGGYYVVREDGRAIEVMIDRQHRLLWR